MGSQYPRVPARRPRRPGPRRDGPPLPPRAPRAPSAPPINDYLAQQFTNFYSAKDRYAKTKPWGTERQAIASAIRDIKRTKNVTPDIHKYLANPAHYDFEGFDTRGGYLQDLADKAGTSVGDIVRGMLKGRTNRSTRRTPSRTGRLGLLGYHVTTDGNLVQPKRKRRSSKKKTKKTKNTKKKKKATSKARKSKGLKVGRKCKKRSAIKTVTKTWRKDGKRNKTGTVLRKSTSRGPQFYVVKTRNGKKVLHRIKREDC